MIKRLWTPLGKEELVADAGRFFGAGVINTSLTVVVYELLLFAVSAPLAYAGAWILGLTFVAFVYPSHVFKGSDASKRGHLFAGGVYLISFGLGIAVTTVVSSVLASDRSAILVALVATTLFNFFAMRAVLRI
jgi:uncharacterized membrane protein